MSETSGKELTADETALAELAKLRTDTSAFYSSTTGQSQLKWLDELDKRLVSQAIAMNNPTEQASYLNQAKGLRLFRAYLDTLTKKN